jgi:hypothetical protein
MVIRAVTSEMGSRAIAIGGPGRRLRLRVLGWFDPRAATLGGALLLRELCAASPEGWRDFPQF